MNDCIQDACENCPFASVGGIGKRDAMQAPEWASEDPDNYLLGYRTQARAAYGRDWMTCGFGWQHALTIGGPLEVPEVTP